MLLVLNTNLIIVSTLFQFSELCKIIQNMLWLWLGEYPYVLEKYNHFKMLQ